MIRRERRNRGAGGMPGDRSLRTTSRQAIRGPLDVKDSRGLAAHRAQAFRDRRPRAGPRESVPS